MALLWIDGFDEVPDGSEIAFLASTDYLFATGCKRVVGRTGAGSALQLTGSTARLERAVGAQTDLIVGWGVKYANELSVDNVLTFDYDDGAAVSTTVSIERNLSNGVQARVGTAGAILGTSPPNVVQQEVYNYLEIRLFLNGATSRVIAKANNETLFDIIFDGTGMSMNRFSFNKKAAGSHTIDDLYVLNASGAHNTTFLGDCLVKNAPLLGNGPSIQWTPIGTVVNVTNVNETGVANDARYNTSNVVGERDMFTLTNFDLLADKLFGVMVGARARKVGAGVATMATVTDDGTTTNIGASWSPTVDFKTKYTMYSSDPSGNPWAVPAFNGMTVGYELIS